MLANATVSRALVLPLCAALALVGLAIGCQPSAPPPAPPPVDTRVESSALGLALAKVPAGFKLLDAASLRLGRTDDQTGELWVEVGPETPAGINLVQVVRDAKPYYEGLPSGQFFGQLELGSPFGATYTVRGRYAKDALAIEERRIFALHPAGDRLLTMVYSYPAGEDTKPRSEQMFGVFGELQALPPETPATTPAP